MLQQHNLSCGSFGLPLLIFLFLLLVSCTLAEVITLRGGGSSAAEPLLRKWGTQLGGDVITPIYAQYQHLDADSSLKRLETDRSDSFNFLVSDFRYPTSAHISGKTCVPIAASAITVIYNTRCFNDDRMSNRSVPALVLNYEAITGIYNGTITQWSHPLLIGLNPTFASVLQAATAPLQPLHRTDHSGTSFVFSKALSDYSPMWRDSVGAKTLPQFPVLNTQGALTDSEDMVSSVNSVMCSVGYVALSAVEHLRETKARDTVNIRVSQMINAAGSVTRATLDSVRSAVNNSPSSHAAAAAASSSQLALEAIDSIDFSLQNQPGSQSWPLTTYHFLCIQNRQNNSEVGEALSYFVAWLRKATPAASFVAPPSSLTALGFDAIDLRLMCGAVSCKDLQQMDDVVMMAVIISVAIILVAVVAAIVAFVILRHRQRNYRERLKQDAMAGSLLADQQLTTGGSQKAPFTTQEQLEAEARALTQRLLFPEDVTAQSTLDRTRIGFDEIVLEEQIGSGSFSEVYKGRWLGTRVAIKRILFKEGDSLDDFLKECSLMSVLRHPNIVQFLGATIKPPHLYIVCEFCERGTVQSIIRDKAIILTLKKKVDMALDSARGMLYLHSSTPPVLHRDLKSANLLVDSNWNVKVSDFGLSRVLDYSKTMTLCGTAETCAPEVLKQSRYTEKADVYSFGIVLWEILTREQLYPGMNFYELTTRVVREGLRPPLTPNLNLPPKMVALMKDCWQENQRKRPSFDYIVKCLEEFSDSLA